MGKRAHMSVCEAFSPPELCLVECTGVSLRSGWGMHVPDRCNRCSFVSHGDVLSTLVLSGSETTLPRTILGTISSYVVSLGGAESSLGGRA